MQSLEIQLGLGVKSLLQRDQSADLKGTEEDFSAQRVEISG